MEFVTARHRRSDRFRPNPDRGNGRCKTSRSCVGHTHMLAVVTPNEGERAWARWADAVGDGASCASESMHSGVTLPLRFVVNAVARGLSSHACPYGDGEDHTVSWARATGRAVISPGCGWLQAMIGKSGTMGCKSANGRRDSIYFYSNSTFRWRPRWASDPPSTSVQRPHYTVTGDVLERTPLYCIGCSDRIRIWPRGRGRSAVAPGRTCVARGETAASRLGVPRR